MISKSDVVFAFGLPPEAAVEFLRAKGLQVTEHWMDMWQAAHSRAFTVARSAGYNVLGDIKEALIVAMENGQSYKQFTEQLKPILQAKGWWGLKTDAQTGEIELHQNSMRPVELGSLRRLKLIYEQNVQTAFMAGRYRTMMDAVVTHPNWEYVAVMDERTRAEHAALNGRVFRHDDPIWSVVYPPNGWRCRCRVRPVSIRNKDVVVDSSDGYITTYEQPRRDGTTVMVQQVQLPSMTKPFRPDVGWDYNPAQEYYRVAA